MGDLRKNPFRGGGMDIFWKYTITGDVRPSNQQLCAFENDVHGEAALYQC